MHAGVTLAFGTQSSRDDVITLARHAEGLGFHSLWVPEHVLLFRDYDSRYPYADNGRIPGDPEGVLDPFSALLLACAVTDRIRLGTGICIVPQRSPVYTAKMVADLDHLSGGRVDFGIGVGWLEEEFRALGVPFADRGPRTDEAIEAMRALWMQELSTHAGERFAFSGALGQGWYGFSLTPEVLDARLEALDGALAAEGRSRADVSVFASARGRPDEALVEAFRARGVDQLLVPVTGRDTDTVRARLDALAGVVERAA
jgi:alkanesulfonate monooxygenase SsuD/methylene tetrahydromethanopterin reductase-like flavin-dependent oxidoreductase (luciferase family)